MNLQHKIWCPHGNESAAATSLHGTKTSNPFEVILNRYHNFLVWTVSEIVALEYDSNTNGAMTVHHYG